MRKGKSINLPFFYIDVTLFTLFAVFVVLKCTNSTFYIANSCQVIILLTSN